MASKTQIIKDFRSYLLPEGAPWPDDGYRSERSVSVIPVENSRLAFTYLVSEVMPILNDWQAGILGEALSTVEPVLEYSTWMDWLAVAYALTVSLRFDGSEGDYSFDDYIAQVGRQSVINFMQYLSDGTEFVVGTVGSAVGTGINQAVTKAGKFPVIVIVILGALFALRR